MALQSLYEVQQKQNIDLMNSLPKIPPEFHSLPFHLWGFTPETLLFLMIITVNLVSNSVMMNYMVQCISIKSQRNLVWKRPLTRLPIINSKVLLSLILKVILSSAQKCQEEIRTTLQRESQSESGVGTR